MPGSPNTPDLIEPVHVLDRYATDVCRIEMVGPCVRYTFCVDSTPSHGITERLIVSKLVLPLTSMVKIRAMNDAFMAKHAPDAICPPQDTPPARRFYMS
jgi:hypothetical protein